MNRRITSGILDITDWLKDQLSELAARAIRGETGAGSPAHHSDRIDIVLKDRFLKLKVSDQKLPLSRAQAVATAFVAERTPFTSGSAYILPNIEYDAADGSGCTACYVIKENVINEVLNAGLMERKQLGRLGIEVDGKVRWLHPRVLDSIGPEFSHLRQWRRTFLTLFALLVMSLGATYFFALERYSSAEQKLAEELDAKRGEALRVRKLLDQQRTKLAAVEAARKSKSQAVPVIRVWEELTRILPDDIWLTDVSIDRGSLTITGYAAQSAASLISTINGSRYFDEPAFTSPVVRIPGQVGERFEIRMQVQAP